MSSRHISIGKEYMRILLLTHPNKTVSHDHGDGSDNVSRKEYAQNLLGRSSCHGRISTQSLHHRDCPHLHAQEKYFGTKPDLSHLKVFGCIKYVHVLDEKRRKLDSKSENMIFMGY